MGSDDEAEENDRLRFICSPCVVPLSVYFRPFYGFDTPKGNVFPPPAIYAACPRTRTEAVAGLGVDDPALWKPAGFHRVASNDCRIMAPDVLLCFAGIAFDDESLVILLYHEPKGNQPCLEVRSNKDQ